MRRPHRIKTKLTRRGGGRRDATMQEQFTVTCPYCGEEVEIYLEPDVRGMLDQDCEVCCNPWQVRVSRDGDERWVEVSRSDGSD